MLFLAPLIFILLVAIPSLATALLLRGGLLLRILGISIVTNDGQPASRWRVFARTLIAWVPLLAADWPVLCLTAFVIGAAVAVYSPSCCFQDQLAGTRLVPK